MTGSNRSEAEPSVGELLATLSEQTARLVRDEVRLAQMEMARKAKRTGLGLGLLGAAGLFALFGTGVLLAAAVLALSLVLSPWASALIVAGLLFGVAGPVALLGRRDVSAGAPPVPTDTLHRAKDDIAVIEHQVRR
jgi:Putative Actinobacterial Holin-X, holin superfamily III